MLKDDYEFSGEVALLADGANKDIESVQCKQLAELKQPLINKSEESEDDEFISQLTDAIHHEIRDVTAKNFGDLMKESGTNSSDIIMHEILIVPNTIPIKQKTRGIPQKFRDDFKKMILEMKDAGMIVDSKSPWCSPVRLVRKKDGSVRVCIDYRKLNNVTIADAYPIPKIEEIFQRLGQARIFSSLDLCSGYYQVKMDVKSREYTAFSCEFGFYEYVVLPMGLTNACATFQRLMNTVLGDLIDKVCLVYLDDIIIFSNSKEEHLAHVKLVIDRLRKYNLKIKLSKCKFAQTRIEYLSHIIENGTIMPNPA